MGYFNIFYKITRIIDMLTRKRNRKAIMVILIIIALVFIFANKVQANTSYPYNVNYYMQLNLDLSSYGEIRYRGYLSNLYGHSYVMPVYSGYIYNFKWTTASINIGYVSNLEQIAYKNNFTGSGVPDNTQNYVTMVASTDSKDFTYTCNQDGFLIIGGFYSQNINEYPNNGLTITTDYDGTSNLTSIHNDLTRIENLLNEYLYGNSDELNDINYDTFNSLQIGSAYVVVQNNNFNINRIRIIKGHTYYITINNTSTVDRNCRYVFSTNKYTPYVGLDFSSEVNKGVLVVAANDSNTLEFSSLADGYLYINTAKVQTPISSSQSDYNPGQDEGIYGGLTDIDSQVKSQGEQTRDTITSTDYNESDVNINTDSVSNIDTSQTDGLFTTIFNNFNSAATGGIDSITIPLPHNSGNIVLYSNVVSSHLGNLSALVSAFWYFVFGLYAFKFVNNLLHSIKDGSILNGFRNNNEVITSDML